MDSRNSMRRAEAGCRLQASGALALPSSSPTRTRAHLQVKLLQRTLILDRPYEREAVALTEVVLDAFADAVARKRLLVKARLLLQRVLHVVVCGDDAAFVVDERESKVAEDPEKGRKKAVEVL